jgi:hypothetical protein
LHTYTPLKNTERTHDVGLTKPLIYISIADTWTWSPLATLNLLYVSGLLTPGAPLQPAVYEPLAGVAGETQSICFLFDKLLRFLCKHTPQRKKRHVFLEKKTIESILKEPVIYWAFKKRTSLALCA